MIKPPHGNTKNFGHIDKQLHLTLDDYTKRLWLDILDSEEVYHLSQREIFGAICLHFINTAPEMKRYRKAKEEKEATDHSK